MRFKLNGAELRSLRAAFNQDKLAKSKRKIKAHGIDRFFDTIEARDGKLLVDAGHVKLSLDAAVGLEGGFSIRDAVFRKLLLTMRDERSLDFSADASGFQINGIGIELSSEDFTLLEPGEQSKR